MDIYATLRYERIREIGAGEGMHSHVFLADDPQLAGQIAVKEIPKASFGNSPDLYYSEAQMMFQVEHPNIVRVQYACETKDQICLAMPFYPSGSLAARIRQNPLSPKDALRMADGVLKGLGRIHVKGCLHLDLKPSNVLFSKQDAAIVADFGQSRRVDSKGVVTISEMYRWALPPETILTSSATVESDLFQAGLLLYRAVNGDASYEQQKSICGLLRTAICKGRFPNRNLFRPHIPKRLKTVIRKALRIEPSERYHSASAMADALAKIELPLNWEMRLNADNSTTWTAEGRDRADLLVQLTPNGQKWDVECWTVTTAGRRAKGRQDIWRKGINDPDAHRHLTEVFAELA